MNWKKTNEKEEDLIEIKIKVPKNTVAMVVNYLEQKGNIIGMGNSTYDEEDILKLKKETIK